jgi:hypothetical protein
MQESWYSDWMGRLKLKDLSSYHKELQKREKSEELFGNVE